MARDNVAVYYGQTDQTSAVELTTICDDPNVEVVILAFVTTLFGPNGWPTLNMGPECGPPTSAQSQAGASGLLDCVSDGFAAQVAQCQAGGKKVFMSLGGAAGYSDTSILGYYQAQELAQTLWDLFLGGQNSETMNAMRPFGEVVLDGFDIDNESDSTLYIDTLISSLRILYQANAGNKYYISAAPQCPIPYASIPLSSMQTSVDFVWVQFYNNPSCNLNSGPAFLESLAAWSENLSNNSANFLDAGNGVTSPRLFVGGTAFAAAGSGYADTSDYKTILQSVNEASIGNLGGVMLWDGAYGEESAQTGNSYMQIAKEVLR